MSDPVEPNADRTAEQPPKPPSGPPHQGDEQRPDATLFMPGLGAEAQQWGQQPPAPASGGVPQQPYYPYPPQGYPPQPYDAQQQWPGQWAPPGAPGAPQQPWSGPAAPPAAGGPKITRLKVIMGVAAALVVLATVGIVAVVLFSGKDTLDQNAAQSGVRKVLAEDYGLSQVSEVSCPKGVKVDIDRTFTCDVTVAGEEKKVTAKFVKTDGTYEVGHPS